jgi:WD40 repeat protein
MFNCYPDLVDIENMSIEKKRYYYRFVEFGSCPKQLFKKPFEKKEGYIGFKQIIDKDVSVITIELKDNKNEKEEKNEKVDIIDLIKENTNIQKYFPLPKKGAKLFYSNYNGLHLSQKKLNEDTYRYDQTLFIYGFGIKFEKYFLGNSLITDNPPCVMYGEGRFLLEGGYLDGLMLLTDFNNNNVEKIYNPNDKSPVTCMVINHEENIIIVGNNIGIIYAYEVNENSFMLIKKIQYHQKAINYLFLSDELNAFISSSEDKYINIYSLPECDIIHSFEIEEPEFALLSGKPLPICITYSKKENKLLSYSVNGHFIIGVEVENIPQYPIIYTNRHFRDYLIYSIKGFIYIRSLPNLESFNIIKLNVNKNLPLNNIYLQYYRNKNGNEQLYALDQSIQTLYVIGDSEN